MLDVTGLFFWHWQIWDQSDPMGKGYLEKNGFFVALKLIALVQSSQELNISKLSMETPAPDLVRKHFS